MMERELKSKTRLVGGMLLARIILAAGILQFPFACAGFTDRPAATRQSSRVLRIGDAVRMKNEVPNELIGMGLVVGLQGTGDGGDFNPTVRALAELMKHFDDAGVSEKALKNSDNVALVTLSMSIPPAGAHAGERLDVKASALAAKSLMGGQLFIAPMYAPRTDLKVVIASASGTLMLPDKKHLTEAVIVGGGVVVEDVLPEEVKDNTLTFIIHANQASYEMASAIADQINEQVAPEMGGKPVAVAADATSVQVTIPEGERIHRTAFIARLLRLRLPASN